MAEKEDLTITWKDGMSDFTRPEGWRVAGQEQGGRNYSDTGEKWKQWKGTKFAQYVRPSTLFSEKFETYLNEQSDSESKITKLIESVEQAKRTDWKLD